MTRDVGTSVTARHPDTAALTGRLQRLDGERLHVQMQKLPLNKLPIVHFEEERSGTRIGHEAEKHSRF